MIDLIHERFDRFTIRYCLFYHKNILKDYDKYEILCEQYENEV